MAYTLIWSDDAQENIHDVISYLLDSWGDSVAEHFSERLIAAGRHIEQMPHSGKRHQQLSAVREWRIQPYHTIFYAVIESEQEVIVLNIIDQRMNL